MSYNIINILLLFFLHYLNQSLKFVKELSVQMLHMGSYDDEPISFNARKVEP